MNHYLEYAGYSACKVHMVRIQKKIYTEDDRILTRKEYARLLQSCSDPRTQLIMETLCSTGIRVSELHYITVENYRKKMIKVYNKGKERVVFLPDRLIAHLRRYIKKRKITSGEIFISRTGKRLDRTAIWRMMKRLCAKAGVDQKKV
ncbi:MAG: tyrosine-type recombinase/integrase [Merdibacter sp.]